MSKKAVKKLLTVLVIVMLGMISFMCAATAMCPATPEEAMKSALAHAPKKSVLGWYSVTSEGGIVHYGGHVELDITQDEYEASMMRSISRCSTIFIPTPVAMADPDDPYVQEIAGIIDGLTSGMDTSVRAAVAAHFVQTGIKYMRDSELYGCRDWWATPMETLYLGRGDCEDKAVLLMSILEAMGIESALLDYPDHIDAAVRYDDSGWLCCYASADTPIRPDSDLDYEGRHRLYADEPPEWEQAIWDGLAASSYAIRRLIS